MEHYSAVKKNKRILSFSITWMNLEGMMLSEISQIEKGTYFMVSLLYRI